MSGAGLVQAERLDPRPGAAVYTPLSLRAYDAFVLGFSGRFVWRCNKAKMLALYDQNVSARHLDIGVGTGYFLDHCRFPVANPSISLLDLNRSSLEYTAVRIRHYSPELYQASVLEPFSIPKAPFDSVGMSFLLHCLPGEMSTKAAAFENVRAVLAPGGVLFGATILGKGISPNPLAWMLLGIYNRRGIMSNLDDSPEGLEAALKKSFREVSITLHGCCALFVAKAD